MERTTIKEISVSTGTLASMETICLMHERHILTTLRNIDRQAIPNEWWSDSKAVITFLFTPVLPAYKTLWIEHATTSLRQRRVALLC
jgi:hypothetical protein